MIVLLLGLLCSVSAQETDDVSTSFETIVVRGTKEDKKYFETAESVSVLKTGELPATGRENNLEVLKALPNVDVNKNGESFSIRGISNTGVTGHQKDNLAALYIDDFFQTDMALQAGSFDLWDVGHIEVLRGAQSTTQGVNSLAGTIFLNHLAPRADTEGRAKLAYGNFDHREAGIAGNTSSLDGKLGVRASYSKELDDGYITNIATNNDKWGRWDRDRARLATNYVFSETTTLNLDLKYHRNKQGGTYSQSADPKKDEVFEDVDTLSTTTNGQAVASLEHRFSDRWRNVFVLGFSKSEQDYTGDADGVAQNTAGARLEEHEDHFASVENRLYFKNENFENLLGLHAHDFKLTDAYDFNLLYPVASSSTPIATQQDVERKRRVVALFDSMTYKLNSNNALVFGVRGEAVDSEYGTAVGAQRLQNIPLPGVNAAIDAYLAQVSGAYSGKNSDFVFLPKVGYDFHDGRHYSGANYTRGYRTAGVSINRRRATAVEYDPEFTDNYEIYYRFKGDDYQIGTNLFYIDWSHQQVLVSLSTDPFDTQVQNAAKSRLYGAELEARYRARYDHEFYFGLGHVRTEFKDFISGTTDYNGNEFPFASPWTARFSHEYSILENLKLFTVLRYVAHAFTNAENTRESEDQFQANMNVRYELLDWTLEGYVYNIFNGRYLLFDGSPASATTPYQGNFHQTNAPRQFGLRASYHF